jgi:hypothetical protein
MQCRGQKSCAAAVRDSEFGKLAARTHVAGKFSPLGRQGTV